MTRRPAWPRLARLLLVMLGLVQGCAPAPDGDRPGVSTGSPATMPDDLAAPPSESDALEGGTDEEDSDSEASEDDDTEHEADDDGGDDEEDEVEDYEGWYD
jgi:hypothetical protein